MNRAVLGAAALAAALPLLMAAPAHASILNGLGGASSVANNANLLGAMLNSELSNYSKQSNGNEHAAGTVAGGIGHLIGH
ncbi:hypothetical protein OHV05_35055 [Kitasatospora sp. NBC_00070]|uniref:hypothetical protein n=1 Tax=Kitasatospora sp. NBC_00070 TaxID=2975962 RepID=UPI00324DF2AD